MNYKKNTQSEYQKRIRFISENMSNLDDYQIEKIVEFSMCTNVLSNFDEIVKWAEKNQKFFYFYKRNPFERYEKLENR